MKQKVWAWCQHLFLASIVVFPTCWLAATHVDLLNTVNIYVTYAFYYIGTPAQGIFVLLYLTRPWRKYGPTRAVMNKAFSLFLVMSQSLIVLHMYGIRPLDWPWWLLLYRVIGDIYMMVAIIYQLAVNWREIRTGYRERLIQD